MLIRTTLSLALALGFAGTAAAQSTPEPIEKDTKDTAGAYGGASYGGATYGGSTYGAAVTPTPEPEPLPVAAPEPVYDQPAIVEESEPSFFERWGMSLSAGGGVEGFTESGTGTDTGGNWNVRLAIGSRAPIGFEASYIGSAQTIDQFGLDDDALLVGNGLQGTLRLAWITGYNVDPFIHGGLAWRHYTLEETDVNVSDVSNDDDVMEVPFGAGVAFTMGNHFLLDTRAEYRVTTYGDLFERDPAASDQNMDRWNVQANLGYQF